MIGNDVEGKPGDVAASAEERRVEREGFNDVDVRAGRSDGRGDVPYDRWTGVRARSGPASACRVYPKRRPKVRMKRAGTAEWIDESGRNEC